MAEPDYRKIRIDIINALSADDDLQENLVLKGGNALSLVYEVGTRTSLDLDFSMERSFDNIEAAQDKIEKALNSHFAQDGLRVFGCKLAQKPKEIQKPEWLGYQLTFKFIEQIKYEKLSEAKRGIQALVTGPGQQRLFTIDLSCYEYTEPKVELELNDYPVYVYTLEMIAIEKLRALCQQMEAYDQRSRKGPRPRDFYDIFEIAQRVDFVVSENKGLAQEIFGAKKVPLSLLLELEHEKAYHEQQWSSVVISVGDGLQSYDFYFEYVVSLALKAEALWNV